MKQKMNFRTDMSVWLQLMTSKLCRVLDNLWKKQITLGRWLSLLGAFSFMCSTQVAKAEDFNPENVKKYQLPFVSESEMIEGFHKVYGQERKKADIPNDRFNEYYAVVGKGILADCKEIKDKDRYRAYAYASASGQLCLYTLETHHEENSTDIEEALAPLRSKFAVKYESGDSVIVCDWYSGVFYDLYRPTPYMSFLISPYFRRYEVKDGKMLLRNPISIHVWGKYREESLDLNFMTSGYPHWLDRTIYECMYFTHDVNRDWSEEKMLKNYPDTGQKRESFSLLFYISEDGHLRVKNLLPEGLSEQQKLLLERLQQIIEKQPAWNFDYLYTADGRVFPGRYLYATYSYESGKWHFLDYIWNSPQKPKYNALLAPYATPTGW